MMLINQIRVQKKNENGFVQYVKEQLDCLNY